MSNGVGAAIKRKPRRGMYVLPSLFTAGNIAAGFYAILQSIHGSMGDWAGLLAIFQSCGIGDCVRRDL